MEKKRGKRSKPMDDGVWDCSVCTFKNSAEAFKCAMCDVRKGTSTRKPKPNPQLVAQQVAQQMVTVPKKQALKRVAERVDLGSDTSQDSHRSESRDGEPGFSKARQINHPASSNGNGFSYPYFMDITVNGLTVRIEERDPKCVNSRQTSIQKTRRRKTVANFGPTTGLVDPNPIPPVNVRTSDVSSHDSSNISELNAERTAEGESITPPQQGPLTQSSSSPTSHVQQKTTETQHEMCN